MAPLDTTHKHMRTHEICVCLSHILLCSLSLTRTHFGTDQKEKEDESSWLGQEVSRILLHGEVGVAGEEVG